MKGRGLDRIRYQSSESPNIVRCTALQAHVPGKIFSLYAEDLKHNHLYAVTEYSIH